MLARATACAGLAVGLASCFAIFDFSGYDTDRAGDGGASFVDPGKSAFDLRKPADLRLYQGRTTDLVVEIERRDGFVGVVTVEVVNAPRGVTFTMGNIDATTRRATLVGSATADAAPGVPSALTIRARNGDLERTVATTLEVSGAPGSLDSSFGDRGLALTEIPGRDVGALDLAVAPGGALVVVGRSLGAIGSDMNPELLLLKWLTADGKDDPLAPKLTTDERSLGYRVRIEADGSVVVASIERASFSKGSVGLRRILRNGAVDVDYGIASGRLSTDFYLGVPVTPGFAAQGSNVLIAGPTCVSTACTVRVKSVRRSDGTTDLSFGDGGIAAAPFGAGDGADVVALADGRTALLARSFPGEGTVSLLTRDGGTDPAFGVAPTYARCGLQQPDGLLVTNSFDQSPVRHLLDGGLDRTFGDGGTHGHGAGRAPTPDVRCGLALQKDGKVLVADATLARYTVDGLVDASFGMSGATVPTTPTGFNVEWASAAVVDSGKILVAGRAELRGRVYLAVARYWP